MKTACEDRYTSVRYLMWLYVGTSLLITMWGSGSLESVDRSAIGLAVLSAFVAAAAFASSFIPRSWHHAFGVAAFFVLLYAVARLYWSAVILGTHVWVGWYIICTAALPPIARSVRHVWSGLVTT